MACGGDIIGDPGAHVGDDVVLADEIGGVKLEFEARNGDAGACLAEEADRCGAIDDRAGDNVTPVDVDVASCVECGT
jgi:hypothetical protein